MADLTHNEPIEALKIGLRTYSHLKRQGINTIDDLVHCPEDALRVIPNFGGKSRDEVLTALALEGLSLLPNGDPRVRLPSKFITTLIRHSTYRSC